MRILGVDTSGPRESVALLDAGILAGEVRLSAPDAHSCRLLPAVSFLLESLGLQPADIDAYAVAIGPGSFTGVRVGISTVQGLGLASGRPCLGVSTLDALAARIRGSAPWLVAMIDAYRDEVFAGLYDADGAPQGAGVLQAPRTFLDGVPAGAAFIGDGAVRYRGEVVARDPEARFPSRSLFLSGTVALLAAARLERGDSTSPSELRPFYLRGADIRPSTARGPVRETSPPRR